MLRTLLIEGIEEGLLVFQPFNNRFRDKITLSGFGQIGGPGDPIDPVIGLCLSDQFLFDKESLGKSRIRIEVCAGLNLNRFEEFGEAKVGRRYVASSNHSDIENSGHGYSAKD